MLYFTGHHGIIWSAIARDTSGVYLHNGTTRHYADLDYGLPDSLSFINDNIKIIAWGFDSLADTSQLLMPRQNTRYNPFYSQLYLIQDGKIALSYNSLEDYYTGADSIKINSKISRLEYLLYWLAAPSARQYMPLPCDTLSMK